MRGGAVCWSMLFGGTHLQRSCRLCFNQNGAKEEEWKEVLGTLSQDDHVYGRTAHNPVQLNVEQQIHEEPRWREAAGPVTVGLTSFSNTAQICMSYFYSGK